MERHKNVESILDESEESIDLAWGWFYYPFSEIGVGDYTIKVFNTDDKLLGEGRLSVVE